ncbi:MAG: FecR domain-containing protein [Odoribacteraceae bacterium]|jgi:ferric-dicitrate binding protein FerR (iron transport regulator)|nr:FecR domain-containing protein [Odoribacteraceae bacterium]
MEAEKWTRWIAGYCRHELTPAEREELDAWLAASPGNRAGWRNAVTRYRRARGVAAWKRVDEQAAWERFTRGIAALVTRRRRRLARRVALLAASVALLLGVGIGHLSRPRAGSDPRPVLSWSTLQPGEARAILRLPDGREIAMGKEAVADSTLGFRGLRDTAGLSYRDAPPAPRVDPAYHSLVIPRKGEYFLVLSDGTRVWLNADSELRYPVTFAGDRREVFLSGEAYFNVARDSARPFIVESGETRVEVLGTKFNVSAYRDEERVVTTLEEGSVQVSARGESRVLSPGTRAVSTPTGLEVTAANAAIDIGWIHRTFEFVEMPLGDITRQLQRWYDVEFTYRDAGLECIPFTGTVGRDLPLQEVLQAIERLADIAFTLQSNRIEVTQK